jgi:hypothetical protein
MKAKKVNIDKELMVIKLFANNYARDLLAVVTSAAVRGTISSFLHIDDLCHTIHDHLLLKEYCLLLL